MTMTMIQLNQMKITVVNNTIFFLLFKNNEIINIFLKVKENFLFFFSYEKKEVVDKQDTNIMNYENLVNLSRYYDMANLNLNQLADNKQLHKILLASQTSSFYNTMLTSWIANLNTFPNGAAETALNIPMVPSIPSLDSINALQMQLNEKKNYEIKPPSKKKKSLFHHLFLIIEN